MVYNCWSSGLFSHFNDEKHYNLLIMQVKLWLIPLTCPILNIILYSLSVTITTSRIRSDGFGRILHEIYFCFPTGAPCYLFFLCFFKYIFSIVPFVVFLCYKICFGSLRYYSSFKYGHIVEVGSYTYTFESIINFKDDWC